MFATQTLRQHEAKVDADPLQGELGFGVTAKDLILGTIGQIGVGGGTAT